MMVLVTITTVVMVLRARVAPFERVHGDRCRVVLLVVSVGQVVVESGQL